MPLFRRSRDRLRDWYLAADVVVATPWYEPFSLPPLEAMACGRAVVGSAVAGVQHTVVDGVSGFVVPLHDPHALAVRFGVLQANPALGAALGAAGAHRVRQHFTWTQVASQLAAVYADLVDVAPPPPAGRHLSLVPGCRAPAVASAGSTRSRGSCRIP